MTKKLFQRFDLAKKVGVIFLFSLERKELMANHIGVIKVLEKNCS